MDISKKTEDAKIILAVTGRLDTVSAPQFQTAVADIPADAQELLLDFGGLAYISSAGLRVILSAHKTMRARGGRLVISGANEIVREVFDMTGLSDLLQLV